VWFITGTSRGFGRVWAQAALERGDSVAATARDTRTLDDLAAAHGERLLALRLDVTDKAGIEESVRRAHEHFGRLDVVRREYASRIKNWQQWDGLAQRAQGGHATGFRRPQRTTGGRNSAG
jgi:enoyl-[acyl-carrier-protein] reductase (NADH)